MTLRAASHGDADGPAAPLRLAVAALVVVLASLPSEVAADPDDEWVRLRFDGEGWTEDVRASVGEDLRAGLARTDIGVEESERGGAEPPAAVLTLARETGQRVGISLESSEPELAPGRHRFVELASVPDANRSWAIAVAAEELLRAHLAERGLIATRLPTAGEPASPAPGPTRAASTSPSEEAPGGSDEETVPKTDREAAADTGQPSPEREPQATAAARIDVASKPTRDGPPRAVAVEPSPRSAGLREVELGVRAAFEHYGGGVQQSGGDAVLRWWPHPRAVIELGLGARGLLPESAPNGRIVGWTSAGELAAGGVPLELGGAWRIEALASVRALLVQFRGKAEADGAVGSRALFGTADVGARVRLAWRVADGWTVRMGGHVGGVLRPLRAADAGQTVEAISGLLVGGTLSVAGGW